MNRMSGSRTAIIGGSNTELNNEVNAPIRKETPKKDDKNTPKNRTTVPLNFKLKLIAEVKKHDIIWQDLKQRKNPDLVENAWQKMRKALLIKKVGFCEKQWKLLVHGYRSHINRGTPMNIDLIREMAFMSSQLKKSSSDEQSDSDAMEPESPARHKAKTPKAKKEAKRNSSVSECEASEDQKASVAILKLLFSNLPSDVMRPVRKSLVEVLIRLMPEVETKISEHAKQEVKMGGDINKIDWSTFDIPGEICKAVWDYKVMQMVLNV